MLLARSSWRAAARTGAVAAATVFCVSATLARAPARVDSATPARPTLEFPELPPTMAALAPAHLPAAEGDRGPFGLAATHSGGLAERWRILQPVIVIERQAVARCRAEPSSCTPAAAKFAAVVAAGQARTGLARIGEINRAVNLAIRPTSDLAQYGVADIWASPLMTFASGAGDCEDYAIAKYEALLEAGVAPQDVRLVVVHNRTAHEDHMVAAARIDGRWLILDNRTMRLVADADVDDLTPLAVLDGPQPAPAVVAAPGGSWPEAPAASALASSHLDGLIVDL
jgi:predicted transglutaminase-like cysteine proteinase